MEAHDDLAAYLARIGHAGCREPTLALLRDLHALHPAAIAFEGLDPFLGRLVDLDPAAIHAKLVRGHRGGYCHEHNALFHDMLAALGFTVVALGGRVIWMAPGRDAPMSHRLTLVHVAGTSFIADVGNGGQTPTAPLRLEPDLEQVTSHGTYCLIREGETFETRMRLRDRWEPMYRFTLEPRTRADFEVANWFTSTHPRTRFTRNLVAARVVGQTRVSLLNASLAIRYRSGDMEQRTLANARDLRHVLERIMGLEIPVAIDEIWARLPSQPVPPWP
jgi:N-hydroxyarylamine O-acetyltransferase